MASVRVGEAAGRTKLLTFDMGGTSADISISRTGAPEFTTTTFVGDFPLIMPVVNVGAIGAGGGSILWVDAQGLLKVGPLSAGADPGPVGLWPGRDIEPTITDCYLATRHPRSRARSSAARCRSIGTRRSGRLNRLPGNWGFQAPWRRRRRRFG